VAEAVAVRIAFLELLAAQVAQVVAAMVAHAQMVRRDLPTWVEVGVAPDQLMPLFNTAVETVGLVL
jgi:hypothetical protein